MMFVDASAIVAILLAEANAEQVSDALTAAAEARTSPLAIYEAALAIARVQHIPPERALSVVRRFLDRAGDVIAPIDEADAAAALEAFTRFGKGRHPAGLNLGDCFAYASALKAGGRILFVGNDFAQTDLASALAAN